MAVLNRDDYFSAVNEIIGTNTDDKSVQFLENMTDTFNDMESKANGGSEDWEKKYHELDESWKRKYTSRFFSGAGRSANPLVGSPAQPDDSDEKSGEDIKIDDLFEPADNDKKE